MGTTEAKPIIEVKDLSAAYEDVVILQEITFEVDPGEVFVILGGSGCGKSTLLKQMIGLLRPVQGSVLIDGEDIVQAEGHRRRAILRKIGVMYQSGALFGAMNLLDNISLVLEALTDLPQEAREVVALMKLKVVGLEQAAFKMPSEISGGMRKRAAIARAMALDPKVLFLDEPSAGLDPVTSARMDDLILQLSQTLNMTFVIVTHELPSIFAITDRAILLDRETRGIVASGVPNALKENKQIPWVYQFFNRQSSATV